MKIINKITNTCRVTAFLSFIIGTILLILFTMTRTFSPIITIGILYIYVAFIINLILFVFVFLSAFYFWQYRLELFRHCGLLVLNIPIAIVYFFIVLKFASL